MIKLSDYVIKMLEATGVRHMFMLPGGGAMHLNDSLGASKKIQYVNCLHEQACSIAAEAYARVTNGPGLLMVTTGPGGINALNGVAAAYIESTPMFVVSGQVKISDQVRGQGVRQQGMQEVDIISMVRGITKYAVMLTDPMSVRYHMERGLYEARAGRPGPVWIDIPLDVQAAMLDEDGLEGFTPPEKKPSDLSGTVGEIIDILNQSSRPVMLAGNGIRLSGAIREFRELLSILNIPLLTTWNGIDLVWEEHPLYYGRPGGLGHRYANFIQQNSDFFMSVGARLNLLQTGYNFDGFARAAKKVMVDIDSNELNKINVRPDIKVCSDAGLFIGEFIRQKERIKPHTRKEWFAYCDRVRSAYPLISEQYRKQMGPANSYVLLEAIADQMGAEDIYVAGSSGSCIEVSMQAFRVKQGQRAFTTKGLASMGYGLPSTIGACLASGGEKTVCVNGDGGFQMNIQELETIRRLALPVKIFVLNNSGYAAIQGTQSNLFNRHFVACNESSNLTMPDIEAVAAAYRLRTVTIRGNDEIPEKVKETLNGSDPVVCNVIVPIDMPILPKQVSYMRSDGQMESLPLEYLNPPLSDGELEENMLIPLYERR